MAASSFATRPCSDHISLRLPIWSCVQLLLVCAASASAARRLGDFSLTLPGIGTLSLSHQQGGLAWRPAAVEVETPSLEAFFSLPDLVTPYGYPCEEHFVITSDGYILRMYRIPHGKADSPGPSSSSSSAASTSSSRKEQLPFSRRPHGPWPSVLAAQSAYSRSRAVSESAKPVALLHHGLLDSAAEFLLLGPGKALAFLMADAGYDVWLANSRGNVYSRNHTHLNVNSDAFWAFSFDEMAAYDLPAELDYMQRVTGVNNVSYVGFSQGSTIALAALSSQPQLAPRIKAAALLAPVAFLKNIRSLPLLFLATMDTPSVFRLLGIHEFLPNQRVVQLLEGQLCFLEPSLCLNILAAISGFDGGHINTTQLPLYLQYTPAGASVQNMAHWAQCVRQPLPNTLAHFDWGSDCRGAGGPGRCNIEKYGRPTPPVYDLGAIKTPLMLMSGGADRLSDPLDVEFLREALSAGVVRREVHVEEYEHLDFVWGDDANRRLYRPVLDFLRQYS